MSKYIVSIVAVLLLGCTSSYKKRLLDGAKHVSYEMSDDVKKIILDSGMLDLARSIFVNQSTQILGKGIDRTILSVDDIPAITNNLKPYLVFSMKNALRSGQKKLSILKGLSNVVEGDIVCISSKEFLPELKGKVYTKKFVSKVLSITSIGVVLQDSLSFAFQSKSFDLKIEFYRPIELVLRDMTITGDIGLYLVKVANLSKLVVKNVKFETKKKRFQGLLAGGKTGMSAIGVYSSYDVEVDSCYFNYVWYGVMAHDACHFVQLKHSKAYKSRHINNSGLGTVDFIVDACETDFCFAGFDSHRSALTVQIKNCKDLNGTIASKLRGRRNIIENSIFEKGIEMTTDIALKRSDKNCYNKLTNSTVYGNSTFSCANVSIQNCQFYGSVQTVKIEGKFEMTDTRIAVNANDKSVSHDVLTIGNSSGSGRNYFFKLENIDIENIAERSVAKGAAVIGLYVPLKLEATGVIKNVRLINFHKGLVLYGGKISASAYGKMKIENLRIENCTYGLFQQKFKKGITIDGLHFENCEMDDNAPEMIFVRDKKNK